MEFKYITIFGIITGGILLWSCIKQIIRYKIDKDNQNNEII